MFAALLPKSAPFFAMLDEQNSLLRRMAGLLVEMLEDTSRMDDVHKEIAFLEEEADLLHSRIVRAQQRPAQIEQGRHAHGETRRDNLGGHHCGYGVGTVMRAVGEVENQSHQHNERQKKRHFKHFSAPLPQWFQPGC